MFPTSSEKQDGAILHNTNAKLSRHFFLNVCCYYCVGAFFFFYFFLVYHMLQFPTVPVVKHWQYHNDVWVNAWLLPWWIVIPPPSTHQTVSPVPSDGSRSLIALILVSFPERHTVFLQF